MLDAMIANGLQTGFGDEWIKLGATSEHTIDGSFSERTMRMSTPFEGIDPPYLGNLTETRPPHAQLFRDQAERQLHDLVNRVGLRQRVVEVDDQPVGSLGKHLIGHVAGRTKDAGDRAVFQNRPKRQVPVDFLRTVSVRLGKRHVEPRYAPLRLLDLVELIVNLRPPIPPDIGRAVAQFDHAVAEARKRRIVKDHAIFSAAVKNHRDVRGEQQIDCRRKCGGPIVARAQRMCGPIESSDAPRHRQTFRHVLLHNFERHVRRDP